MTRHLEASAYIARIRNKKKRDYARNYWAWLRFGHVFNESEPPTYDGLGYMAAQEVRMELGEYLREYVD